MSLVYVDFIAKNVEVCVKYYVNREPRWFTGKIVKVLDRYIDDNIDDCVKCVVKYEKDKYTEVFCDKDYNTDDENAWCFSNRFTPLVENIKSIMNEFDESEEESSETDKTCSDTMTESSEEHHTDTDTSTETSVESETLENYQQTTTKHYSLMNNIGATLLMLTPWIASAVVLFNARNEICNALQNV